MHPPKRGLCIWITGLSGAGKSTIATPLAQAIEESFQIKTHIFDGDEVRENLSQGLSFSQADRDINIRRIGYVANLVVEFGGVAIVAAISPYRAIREEVRQKIGDFIEVYLDVPLEVCEQRDVKGLYAKARAGDLKHFTGVSDPYEAPTKPEISIKTHQETLKHCINSIISYIEKNSLLKVS